MGSSPRVSDSSVASDLDEEARDIALRARAMDGIELTSVLLWGVSVTRGGAEDVTPGGISESASYRMQRDADNLWFEVCSTFAVTNAADDKIADMEIAYLVGFDVDEGREFSDDEGEVILSQARLAAYPFTRQKVMSLSADMGLQPIVMPLMRRSTMAPSVPKS